MGMQNMGSAPARNDTTNAKPGVVASPKGAVMGKASQVQSGNGHSAGSAIKGFGSAGKSLGTADSVKSGNGHQSGAGAKGFGSGLIPGMIK